MMALVLVTSCFVGGTFAKYVTSGESTNTARVAKWGVVVNVDSSGSFQTDYKVDYPAGTEDDDKYTFTYSVSSEGTTGRSNVVAPGTSGEVVFSITGTPETAVKVKVSIDDDYKDVVLTNGYIYPYGTTYAEYEDNKWFSSSPDNSIGAVNSSDGNAYYPVQYTLWKFDEATNTWNRIYVNGASSNKLSTLSRYLVSDRNAEVLDKSYAPGTNLGTTIGTFKITWEWPFDSSATNNIYDTLLGDIAANGTGRLAFDYDGFEDILWQGDPSVMLSTDISFTLNITVEQID